MPRERHEGSKVPGDVNRGLTPWVAFLAGIILVGVVAYGVLAYTGSFQEPQETPAVQADIPAAEPP